MTNKKWMIAGLLAALSGAFSASASAQAAEEAAAKEDGGEDAEASKHPMGWFGLGLTIGAGGVGSGQFEIDNPAYDSSGMLSGAGVSTGVDECPIDSPKCKVESEARTGFQLNLKMTFGGEGFGWDLDPYINIAGNGNAYGMYTGWKYDVHAIDPLYIGFGFGPKLAYVVSDKFDYGADVYARGMVRGTYYLLNELGIVAELGLGYGSSGYVALPTATEENPKVSFGSSMTWDFSVGTRWP